ASACSGGPARRGGAGGWTALRGGGWPAMGARYERPTRTVAGSAPPAAGPSAPLAGRRTTEAWDALDRGEDPTAG
ncbi:Trp biosynthesis-associated membrane protein, partial [Micromonospora sp. STR1_7]